MTEVTIRYGLELQDGDLEKLLGSMPNEIEEADEDTRKAWAISQMFQQPIMVKTFEMLEELGLKTYSMDSFQVAEDLLQLEAKRDD